MIKGLIKLANHLDRVGLTKEADYVDAILKKAYLDNPAEEWMPIQDNDVVEIGLYMVKEGDNLTKITNNLTPKNIIPFGKAEKSADGHYMNLQPGPEVETDIQTLVTMNCMLATARLEGAVAGDWPTKIDCSHLEPGQLIYVYTHPEFENQGREEDFLASNAHWIEGYLE